MLLSEDQWVGLELAHQNAYSHHRAAEELLQLLWERATHESHYAQGLKRLASHPDVTNVKGSLCLLIKEMKAEWRDRATLAEKTTTSLIAELIDPLKELLKHQMVAYNNQYRQVTRAQKELKACKDRVSNAKNAYKRQLQETESVVLTIERTTALSEKKKLISSQHEDINKNMEKATKAYRDAINGYNTYLSKYQEEVSTVLSSFKMQEEDRLKAVTSGLKSLHEVEIRVVDDLKSILEESNSVYNSLDVTSDIEEFEADNRSESLDHRFEEFSPYRGVHKAFQELCEASPVLEWVGDAMCFDWHVDPEEKLLADTNRAKAKIEYLMHKAWTESMSEEDVSQFRMVVEEPVGRKVWVSHMNARRASGSFRLTKTGYDSVAALLKIVLDICEAKHDITTASSCTILSQTFHNFRGTEKEFLQASILNHALWSDETIWAAMLNEAIESELEKQRAYGGDSLEGDVKNAVFTQLSAFMHVMLSFGVDGSIAKRLMEKRCWEYKLSSDEMNLLMEVDSPQLSGSPAIERSRSLDLPSNTLEDEEFVEILDRRSSVKLLKSHHS